MQGAIEGVRELHTGNQEASHMESRSLTLGIKEPHINNNIILSPNTPYKSVMDFETIFEKKIPKFRIEKSLEEILAPD
jgi:hypothetical protein